MLVLHLHAEPVWNSLPHKAIDSGFSYPADEAHKVSHYSHNTNLHPIMYYTAIPVTMMIRMK